MTSRPHRLLGITKRLPLNPPSAPIPLSVFEVITIRALLVLFTAVSGMIRTAFFAGPEDPFVRDLSPLTLLSNGIAFVSSTTNVFCLTGGRTSKQFM